MVLNENDGYIRFITSESNQNQIELWFRIYNITYEKIELFYDFFISLLELIDKTYLGFDVLKKEEDMKNHFIWCFNETVNNFEKEKISFKKQGYHFDYLWLLLLEAYYYNINEDRFIKLKEFFFKVFDFSQKKSQIDLEMMTDMYKLLDQNLIKQ